MKDCQKNSKWIFFSSLKKVDNRGVSWQRSSVSTTSFSRLCLKFSQNMPLLKGINPWYILPVDLDDFCKAGMKLFYLPQFLNIFSIVILHKEPFKTYFTLSIPWSVNITNILSACYILYKYRCIFHLKK